MQEIKYKGKTYRYEEGVLWVDGIKHKELEEVKHLSQVDCLRVDDRLWDGDSWYVKTTPTNE